MCAPDRPSSEIVHAVVLSGQQARSGQRRPRRPARRHRSRWRRRNRTRADPRSGRPAADSPTIRRVPGRSAARTAKPSIAELANGGRSTLAAHVLRGDASSRRRDRHRLRPASGRARSSTRCCASSKVSSEATPSAYGSNREAGRRSRRALPARRAPGPRSHVGGLARARRHARPDGCAQDPARRPPTSSRFRREAKSLAALAHENVMRVYDYGEDEAGPFIALEWLPGGTLEDRLKQGALPSAETRRVAHGIAAGLAHLHDRGLVHRDLKPANVLFDEEERPKLARLRARPPRGGRGHADRGRDGARHGCVPLARTGRRRAGRRRRATSIRSA